MLRCCGTGRLRTNAAVAAGWGPAWASTPGVAPTPPIGTVVIHHALEGCLGFVLRVGMHDRAAHVQVHPQRATLPAWTRGCTDHDRFAVDHVGQDQLDDGLKAVGCLPGPGRARQRQGLYADAPSRCHMPCMQTPDLPQT